MIRVFNQYISPKSVILLLLEGGLIAIALVGGVFIRFWNDSSAMDAYLTLPNFTLQAIVFVATLQLCFYYCDMYTASAIRGRHDQVIAVGESVGAGCLLLGILYFIFPPLVLSRGVFFISVTLVPVLVTVSRMGLDRIWLAAAPKENVLILGTESLACRLSSELEKRSDLSVRVAGFLDLSAAHQGPRTVRQYPVWNSTDGTLETIVEQHAISRIIVALEDRRNVLPTRELVRLRVQGIRVEEAHSTMAALTGRVWLDTVKPSWFVFTDGFHRSSFTLIGKRAVDLAAGITGLVLSAPLMLLVAIAIRLDSRGPVLYCQTRVGLRGKCFRVLKFRSMRPDAEAGKGAQWALDNDPRITRVGGFLRKYRLDELPQFMNVIRGEMSLVGPRPERPEFVESLRQHISYYDERHSVRPGLTGWAQVQYSYGNTVESAARKLEYDLFYLKNLSVFFDAAIILDTVRIVLSGRGSK
jgi:sugar transferase (PEP-CTERM system associated)